MCWRILCGFEMLVKSGSCPIGFQNQTTRPTFFKNGSQLHRRSRVFLRQNFRDNFFLLRVNFKGISFIKLKAISIFWCLISILRWDGRWSIVSVIFFYLRYFKNYTHTYLNIYNKFLVGFQFWSNWWVAPRFFKISYYGDFFKKLLQTSIFYARPFSRITPCETKLWIRRILRIFWSTFFFE